MVTNFFSKAHFSLLLVSIFLFSCTTSVKKEIVSKPPPEKISSIYTVWREGGEFSIHVTSRGIFTENSKKIAREGSEKIISLLRAGLKDDLPESLRAVGLCSVRKEMAKGQLQITPAAGVSNCSTLGCQNDVDMFVTLKDPTGEQTYWTGIIRTGATWPSEQTTDISKAFYKTVMERLKENQLVQPGVCAG